MTDGAPLRVLAKLDRDTDAAWFVRVPSSEKCARCSGNGRIELLEHCPVCKGSGTEAANYVRWPLTPNVLPVFVPASRLVPVDADFHKYIGDWHAVAEIHAARDRAAQGAAPTSPQGPLL